MRAQKPFPKEKQETETSRFFTVLQLFGFHEIETAFLAGLVTGEPILLIGSHGTAKTLLAQRVATELGLRFWAYDAAKSMFEDLIGFPDPNSLRDGAVSYVRTPLSIFDKEFILVDEISRANPALQSKWLDIIRSRQIMGMPIPGLQFIIAAMNPAGGYAGAIPLDRALAGRFGFHLPIPEFTQMEPADMLKVMTHRGRDDAPGLEGGRPSIGTVGLAAFVRAARERCASVEARHGRLVETYEMNVVMALRASKVPIDGRRAAMLYRNVIACLAVREEKNGGEADYSPDALRKPLWDALRFSMPFAAAGEEVSEGVVLSAHGVALKALRHGADQARADAVLRLLTPRDPVKAARTYREVAPLLSATDHQGFITRLEDAIEGKESVAEMARAFLAVREVVALYQTGRVTAPADVLRRAMQVYRKALDVSGVSLAEHPEVAAEFVKSASDTVPARLAARKSLANKTWDMRIRPTPKFWPRSGVDPERFRAALAEIQEEFARHRHWEEVA